MWSPPDTPCPRALAPCREREGTEWRGKQLTSRNNARAAKRSQNKMTGTMIPVGTKTSHSLTMTVPTVEICKVTTYMPVYMRFQDDAGLILACTSPVSYNTSSLCWSRTCCRPNDQTLGSENCWKSRV